LYHCGQAFARELAVKTSQIPPWLAVAEGIDEHRPLTASTLRQLLRLGLSRFEPSPLKAIENERERRKALGIAAPTGDAA